MVIKNRNRNNIYNYGNSNGYNSNYYNNIMKQNETTPNNKAKMAYATLAEVREHWDASPVVKQLCDKYMKDIAAKFPEVKGMEPGEKQNYAQQAKPQQAKPETPKGEIRKTR